jgi:RNA polymerase sigma-70 factor (ECF subfamily)
VNTATTPSSTISERDLLVNAQQGDHQAFAHIVQSYQRPVYNLCYRMLGDQAEAEDATQETFIRAYTNLDRFNTDRKFINWVLTIASNHCVDRLRKRRINWSSLEDEPLVEKVPMPESIDPHRSAVRQEMSDQVQALIDQLPPDYRTPLVLLYWYGYSYEEIAEILDITVPAVKSRLHRARKRLAKMMTDAPQSFLAPDSTPGS